MIYAKQSEFPYLKRFKDKFKITGDTIFAYNEVIYSDFELTPDLLIHELKHLERQRMFGADAWVKEYLDYPKFRLQEELIAFIAQLRSISDRNEKNKVRLKAARSLSGELYGGIITNEEAYKRLNC